MAQMGFKEKASNRSRSRFRVRVEQVFGAQCNDMGGTLVRSIGLVRATARPGLENLACNMRRLVQSHPWDGRPSTTGCEVVSTAVFVRHPPVAER